MKLPTLAPYTDSMPTPIPMNRSSIRYWSGPARALLIITAIPLGLRFSRSEGSAALTPLPWPVLVVDANTVPVPVLEALPGLGPTLAGRIAEARASRPFSSLADLDHRVKGIGPVKAAGLTPFLRFPVLE